MPLGVHQVRQAMHARLRPCRRRQAAFPPQAAGLRVPVHLPRLGGSRVASAAVPQRVRARRHYGGLAAAVLRVRLNLRQCRNLAALLFEAGFRIRPPRHWRRNLALLLAAVGLLSGFTYTNYPSSQAVVSMTLPKPALPSQSWRERTAQFGQRLHEAFGVRHETAMEFASWILEAAERQHLAPELIASLVFTESSFRKVAFSSVGAVGPAQIQPQYWSDFCGVPDLHDPELNVYCGAQILAHLKELCGGLQCALVHYNVGVNWRSNAEAGSRYVSKIDRHLAKLEPV